MDGGFDVVFFFFFRLLFFSFLSFPPLGSGVLLLVRTSLVQLRNVELSVLYHDRFFLFF